MVNAFDTIYEEGCDGRPAYITVALHARYMGRPGRFPAIKKFVVSSLIMLLRNNIFSLTHIPSQEYISHKEGVWVATREEIARHWAKEHPYRPTA